MILKMCLFAIKDSIKATLRFRSRKTPIVAYKAVVVDVHANVLTPYRYTDITKRLNVAKNAITAKSVIDELKDESDDHVSIGKGAVPVHFSIGKGAVHLCLNKRDAASWGEIINPGGLVRERDVFVLKCHIQPKDVIFLGNCDQDICSRRYTITEESWKELQIVKKDIVRGEGTKARRAYLFKIPKKRKSRLNKQKRKPSVLK